MRAIKIGAQGQLVLPDEVTRSLDLRSGTLVHVEVEGNVVRLVRATETTGARTPGTWAIEMSDDFDAPLTDFAPYQ